MYLSGDKMLSRMAYHAHFVLKGTLSVQLICCFTVWIQELCCVKIIVTFGTCLVESNPVKNEISRTVILPLTK